jgi:hypothetical protein
MSIDYAPKFNEKKKNEEEKKVTEESVEHCLIRREVDACPF